MIIFIFGDSITQGYWDADGGWADKIRARVMKRDIDEDFRYYHGVHNLGIDGNVTRQVIDRFDNEVDARLWRNSEYGFIFAIGTNDTAHRNDITPEANSANYSQQIKKLYTKASQYSSNIAFVNLLPVDESLTNPLPISSTGKCFTNDHIEFFNDKLNSTCKELNVEIIDARSKYLKTDYTSLFKDGLHPNHQGHSLIFDSVFPVIESWLYPES